MRLVCFLIIVCVLALPVWGYSYPVNYLSEKLGCSIATTAKLNGDENVKGVLSDEPVSKGGFTFTDTTQPQVFTVDFGQEREFNRIQLGSDNKGGPRCPKRLSIQVSGKGPDGPFRTVLVKGDIGFIQVIRLPLIKARWVRFDFTSGAAGTYVHSLRIYKSYKHPDTVAVTKALHSRIKPKLSGLVKFYAAAEQGDWKTACRCLREYYALQKKLDGNPDSKYDLSRAEGYASGKLDFAGIVSYDTVPIDWAYQANTDWYEHKNFLNRGAPLGVPVDAYFHTGDKIWAQRFKEVFYDWLDANPEPPETRGADFSTWRTLDSACRSQWLTSRFSKVTAGKDIDDELWANYLYSIWEHADFLKGDHFTGGNWLAMSTSAVMDIALMFPEFLDQKAWLTYGKETFETNVLRDIRADGKEIEDAPGYVCMAYSGMFATLTALDKASVPIRPEVRERMNKVLDFLGAIIQPDCTLPAIGDSDGGPIPYGLEGQMEYFKREDIRYILTKGKKGTIPAKASVNFPEGGWSTMRSAYDDKPYEDARHLIFKMSRDSHGHNDVHNITVYAYGRELLIDPGIRSYEGADVERYLHTSYHNTICIDGGNQTKAAGETNRWVSNAGIDYVSGTHHGYKLLDHRRSVLFVKPDYWIVHDDIQGEGEHTYDQNWHFPYDAGVTGDSLTKAIHTSYATGGNILLVPVHTESLKSEIKDFFIAKSMMPGDGGQIPSKGWKYSRSGTAPQVFDTLLYPFVGSEAPRVSVKVLSDKDVDIKDVTMLEIANGDARDYVFISRAGPRTMSVPSTGITVDGEVAVVRMKGSSPVRVSGSNLKSVSVAGKELYQSESPVSDVDEVIK